MLWSDESEHSGGESPRIMEVLFQVSTARRINNVWSNRVQSRMQLMQRSIGTDERRVQSPIDYSDIYEKNHIRRVSRCPNNSSNFQVQCLNVDSYLAHLRQSKK